MIGKRWPAVIAIICLLLCTIVGFAHYQKYDSAYKKNINQIIETSRFQLRFTARNFARLESQVASTVKLTNQNRELDDYIQNKSLTNRKRVEGIWLALANYQHFFKKIRFVDTLGNERIKVVYSNETSGVTVNTNFEKVDKDFDLQRVNAIPEGSMVSLNLMLESSSENEIDFIPVRNVVTPVFHDGELKGYIVLTIDIWSVASILGYSPLPDYIPQLLTSSGDYVSHPDKDKLFGFSIPQRKRHNLGLTHNALWQDMVINGEGFRFEDDGLYIYQPINITENKTLYALIYFSNDKLTEKVAREYSEILESAILIMFLIFMVSIPLTYLISNFDKKNIDSSLAVAALNGMSALVICDNRYRVVKVNAEFEKLTGKTEHQILGNNVRNVILSKHQRVKIASLLNEIKHQSFWEGELIICGKNNKDLITITRVQALLSEQNNVTNYIITIVDISKRKALEEQLRYLSERDELSQLWNRRKFEQELRREASLFERYPENNIGCLALLDLDYFKRINDQQGHDEGDRVIKRVSALLAENTRKTDFVARIGGEEFAIIMRHTDLEQAYIVLERIRDAIETDESNITTVSIGYTDITSEMASCYKCADIALYESKTQGRNQVSLCKSSDDIA